MKQFCMIKKVAVFIISTFLNTPTLHARCGTVDLTNPDYLRSVGKDALIEHFKKPRSQDSTGFCSGYSSSDAISFATGVPVSALYMSVAVSAENQRGLDINEVIKNVQENGYCPESSIPSSTTYSSDLGESSLYSFLDYFQEYINKTNGGQKNIDDCGNCTTMFFEKYLKPTIPGSILDLVNEVIKKNANVRLKSVREILTRVCGKNLVASPNIEFELVQSVSNQQYVNKIQEALENSSMPVIVIDTSTFVKVGPHYRHAMVVAGKRIGSNGKCEYMIRNSWGRSCSFYTPEVANTCNENTGTFWLPESQLTKTLDEVAVVKSSGSSKSKKTNNSRFVAQPEPISN